MDIHHLDVVITNGLVALLSLYCGFSLLNSPTMQYDLRRLFVGCFLSVAVGSAVAGYFHGYLQDGTDELRPIVWRTVVLFLGLASYYLWKLFVFFSFPQRLRRFTDVWVILMLIGFCYVVTNVRDDFLVVAAFYVPAVFLLTLTLVIKWFSKKDARYFQGVLAMVITLIAIAVQFLKYDIDPDYMSHNAIYHLIQAVGLYVFFRFSQRMIVWST